MIWPAESIKDVG